MPATKSKCHEETFVVAGAKALSILIIGINIVNQCVAHEKLSKPTSA